MVRRMLGKRGSELDYTGQQHSQHRGQEATQKMLTLLKDRRSSDVQIICENKIFSCHRFILVSKSEFFNTALTGPWLEAQTGIVRIGDEAASNQSIFLEIIYSRQRPVEVKTAVHAAIFYGMGVWYQAPDVRHLAY